MSILSQDPDFPRYTFFMYVLLVFIFNEVTYEVIARYVDIVGNADHYCLNFLLMIIFMDILYDLYIQ